jgi:branched-chain amino acid aminotransferase
MSENIVYLNGALMPADQAAVSVFDAGLLHGASVFTTLLAHKGVPFRLGRHLDRLLATAERIGLLNEAPAERLTSAVSEVLEANGLSEARLRITLTPGAAGEFATPPTTVVTAAALGELPPAWYETGLTVIISRHRQYEGDVLAGLKTGCYLPRMIVRQQAAALGAEEAVWFTASGRLAEACFCNVFLVRDGAVYTPSLETPVLGGIVREAVVEVCGQLGIACRIDKPLTIDDTLEAGEMFLTSSTAGVRPVVKIEQHVVGDGKPGAITQRLLAAYRDLLEEECAERE